jgi:uncharacterized protein YndB with AHSA1/START domain
MARNSIHVQASPEAVFAVLSDPRLYANWVVGASTTRAVEGRWPEPGARLHHTQLLVLHDTTSVLESDPPRRLRLEARARPAVIAQVEVRMEPEGDGTRVVLEEWPTGGLAGAVPRPLIDPLLQLRNREVVRRLKRLTELGLELDRA